MTTLYKSLLGILSFLVISAPSPAQEAGNPDGDRRILVFTKTNGHRHQSIEKGVATLRELSKEEMFSLDHTEDSLQFNPDTLSLYELVIFLSTTGDVLGPAQEASFRQFIEGGGHFMGIHAATDTEYDWPWYGELVGAYFESHPELQQATLQVVDPTHTSTSHMPERWSHFDEWYNFMDIHPGINVLINLDESTYEGGSNGAYHPIAWYHSLGGSRVFYTGIGHTEASFDEPIFRRHLLGGIRYCLGIQ
ncbi:MAG: ThuA domain-containing protein [Robiginitalea sp.]|jgi:type 1 glutamine amidotransferase